MRHRIDIRWVITTSVVVAVAGAGTAAVMRSGGASDVKEAVASAELSPHHLAKRLPAKIEPARLSHEAGGSHVDPGAFDYDALPPVASAAEVYRANEARRSNFSSAFVAWSNRQRLNFGGGGGSGSASFGAGGGSGSGFSGRSAGSAHTVSTSNQTSTGAPQNRPNPGSGSPRTPATPPRPFVAPPAPAVPPAGNVVTMPAAHPSPVDPGVPAVPVATPPVTTPPGGGPPPIVVAGPPVPIPPIVQPPIGDPPPVHPPSPGGGPLSPTPEPGSLMLIGTGLAGMYGALRRRFR